MTVNNIVRKMPWCDCDIIPSSLGTLTIACSEDLTYFHTLEMTFVGVLHVHCRFYFQIDPMSGIFKKVVETNLPAVIDKTALDNGYKQYIIEDEEKKIHTIICEDLIINTDLVLRYFKADLAEGQRIASWVTKP